MKQSRFAVTLYNEERLQYVGENLNDVLQEMWDDHFDEQEELEGACFTVSDIANGTKEWYQYLGTYFHYCFAKGRCDVEFLLKACKVA